MTNSTCVGRGRLRARLALTLSTILCSGLAAPAFASSPHPNLDANGVDLTDGTFNPRIPIASIGSGQAELALVATPVQGNTALDNWSNVDMYQTVSGGVTQITVRLGASSDSFSSADSFAASQNGSGATITRNGDSAVYRTLDGVTVAFANLNPQGFPGGSSNFCTDASTTYCHLLPTAISGRSGMTVAYEWDVQPNCVSAQVLDTGDACNEYWRLRSVSNGAGYGIAWTYVNETGSPVAAYFRQATATLSNANASGASRVVTYAYPSAGVTTITTPGGKTWGITAPSGPITGIRRPGAASDTLTTTYSGGVLASVTNDGVTTAYARGVTGNTATMVVTDALNHATTIVSDMVKYRPTSVTDALNRTTTMAYDTLGRPTEIAYPEGNKVQYTYDARGNVTETRVKAKPGSALGDIVTSASYDAACSDVATCNQPTSTTDARGNVTDYGYDPDTGLLTSVTAPALTTGATRPQVRYTYAAVAGVSLPHTVSQCRSGAALACVGTADEVVTTLDYDANLNTTSASVAAGDASLVSTSTAAYDANGDVTSVDGPLSGSADTTTFRYDADRRRVGTIAADPDGSGPLKRQAVRQHYDDAGRPDVTSNGTVTGTSDAEWNAYAEAYHAYSQYDANGRVVRQTSWSNGTDYSVSDQVYDAVGRPLCTVVHMDPAQWGPLATSCAPPQTNGPKGPDRVTKTTYDAAGQVTKVQSASGTANQADEASSTYNPNGTVASLTDANGNVTGYTYDGFDRLAETHYPLASTGATSPTDYATWTYDATGNVTAARARAGQLIGYTYDALDRPTLKDMPGGSAADVYYGYDLTGALTSATFASAGGAGVSFGYDALGRTTSTTNTMSGASRTLSYDYDAAGNRTRITHPDGAWFDYAHDVLGRVTQAWWTKGSIASVSFFGIGYDDLGRRTGTGKANGSTPYSYDAVGRLATLGQSFLHGSLNTTTTLGYNPVGQIASETRTNDAYAYTGHANRDDASGVNGLNQLTSVGSASLSYDANGNLTSDGSTSYGYDVENRLVSVSGAHTLSLAYDPLGRLWQTSGGGLGKSQFVYDGSDMVAEYDGDNGLMRRRFFFGPGTDEVALWDEGSALDCSGTKFLHADERGSIVAVADCFGNPVQANTYDEYGKPDANNYRASDFRQRFQYTGQMWLPEAGLYYYKARMYVSGLGRFMQTDPIGYGAGMNPYPYAEGDPVNQTDASGLDPDDIVVTGQRKSKAEAPAAQFSNSFGGFFHSPVTQSVYGSYPSPLLDAVTGEDIVVTAQRKKPPVRMLPGRQQVCTPQGLTGNCSLPYYLWLRYQQQQACTSDKLQRCTQDMPFDKLREQIKNRLDCANLREKLNSQCFAGGDQGHRDAVDQLYKGVARCQNIGVEQRGYCPPTVSIREVQIGTVRHWA